MEIVPNDEKNIRRAIWTGISEALNSYYGDLLKDPIPSRLTELSRRLVAPNEADGEEQ
jgi:hypothetical protein